MLEAGTGGGKGGEEAGKDKFKTGSAGGGGGGGNQFSSSRSGQVYMGTQPGAATYQHGMPGNVRTERGPSTDLFSSKSEAYDFLGSLGAKGLANIQARMRLAGMIDDNDGYLEMLTKWKRLVDAAAGLTRGGQKISPFDILDSYLGKGPFGGKGGMGLPGSVSPWQVQYRGGRKFLVNSQTGEVKYEGPRFQTTYDKTIDLTDPTTAKAIATSVFQQMMHRDPGSGELGSWGDALRNAEQGSPVVTKQTTEYDMNTGEPIGTSEERTGGISSEGKQYMAEQRVKKTKEYASTQAATTYMNALENAIFNNPYGSI